MSKKLIALLMAAMMILSLAAACGKTEKPDDATQPDTTPDATPADPAGSEKMVHYTYLGGDHATLNFLDNVDSPSETPAQYCMAYLYRSYPDDSGKNYHYICDCAAELPIQIDDYTWQIKIREDAVFHNGEPLTANDWYYTFQKQLDPILAFRMSTFLADNAITIKNAEEYAMQGTSNTVAWEDVGIKLIDDYTLEITTVDANSQTEVAKHFENRNNTPVYQPLFEECLSEDGATTSYGADLDHWVGSGPYYFTTWDYDSLQIYTKNENYWIADLFHFDEINIRIVPEMNARVELWEQGLLDDLTPDAKTLDQYYDDPRMTAYGSTSVYHVDINCKNPNNPICDSDNYRKAIYHSLDRELMADSIFGHMYPSGVYVNTQAGLLSESGLTYRESEYGKAVTDMVASWSAEGHTTGYNPELAYDYFLKALEEKGLPSDTVVNVKLAIDESDHEWKAAGEFLMEEWPKIFHDQMNIEIVAYAGMSATAFKETGDDKWDLSPNDWSRGLSRTYPYTCFYYYLSTYSGSPNNYFNEDFEAQYAYCDSSEIKMGDYDTLLAETQKLEELYLEHVIQCPVVQCVNYQLFSDDIVLPVETYVPGFGWGTMYAYKTMD